MARAIELIRRRMVDNAAIAAELSRYASAPAVFYQTAPEDTDDGWDGGTQYPRIELIVEHHAEAEHDTAGKLHVDITCSETGTPPEAIEPLVRRALTGLFFYPEGEPPFAVVWNTSMSFQAQSAQQQVPLLVGITADFDLVSFPGLETSDPDPVAAINRYAREWDKSLTIVSKAECDDYLVPTRGHPAVHFRKVSSSIDRMTNTVTWVNAILCVHFFAPELQDRCEWIDQFAQSLALDTEITMLDGSPMFIQNIRGNAAADELQGQLQVTVQYGLLRRPKYAHTMTGMRLGS